VNSVTLLEQKRYMTLYNKVSFVHINSFANINEHWEMYVHSTY